jgi:hypothetical protein
MNLSFPLSATYSIGKVHKDIHEYSQSHFSKGQETRKGWIAECIVVIMYIAVYKVFKRKEKYINEDQREPCNSVRLKNEFSNDNYDFITCFYCSKKNVCVCVYMCVCVCKKIKFLGVCTRNKTMNKQ